MSTAFAPPPERRLFGIGLALVAYFVFTGIDSSAKWLGQLGFPLMQIVFLRYVVHLALVSAINLPQQGLNLVRTGNLRLQILRAVAMLGMSVGNFLAVQYLPLTVTGAIGFTMPLILCALSVPMLGETVGWRRWAAIGVGFIGVLVIVRPGSDAFHPASLLALAGTASSAFYFIFTRRLAGVDSPATSQFYVGIFSTLVLAPFALANWVWPDSIDGWIAFFAIGMFGFVGHQLITVAYGFAPAAVIAPFSYLQIIFMALAGWLVFDQLPDIWLYAGAPIVIGSGLYIWLRERQLAKPVVTPIAEVR
ncbi:DMT family transporter [Devosia sp. J2-20]|uniref:DMT family transporter n=1 Tax=Devosia sp. J2-20 TaxID=3026161 RepID=UPI00249CA368|nr:DMT family transporter [Devosia sp. J2-20]WDQ97843.1 DMT family transporter [Devosia sp. J2-20]